jgi:hypothetical protein
VLYIAASLDGYIAGEDDDLSWLKPLEGVDTAMTRSSAPSAR